MIQYKNLLPLKDSKIYHQKVEKEISFYFDLNIFSIKLVKLL